jgi:putative DNA primase/helicase
MNARQLLARFAGVKKISGGWMVNCPHHDDSTASLKIAEGEGGKAILYCHAGCSTPDIVSSLGLQMSDLFPDAPPPAAFVPPPAKAVNAGLVTQPKPNPVYKGDAKIVGTYDYRDVDGTLLYQVIRKEPKQFLQRRPDGEGGWIWKVAKQVKRVPYRLPDLLARPVVFVVEGEKDADRLWTMDIAATCNAGGAGKWGASESKALAAACVERVIVIPDNDDPGQKHASDVAAKCKKQGLAVSVINLPGLPHHGDVSDWLNANGTKDDLLALAAIPYVLPQPTGKPPQGYSGPVLGSGPIQPPTLPSEPDTVEVEQGNIYIAKDGSEIYPPLADPTAYGSPHGDGAPMDVGAARAFVDRFGYRVRFDHSRDQWFVWTGHYWKPDATALVYQLAMKHAQLWQQEAAAALHYPKRAALSAFLYKLERRQAIENMLTCASWMDPISTEGSTWNTHQYFLGVKNGVIDLKTGELKPGERHYHMTQIGNVEYDADAKCPRWDQFIKEIFNDDLSLMIYVQRALGYSLTADMREQAFFMCVGTGSNGKSIFLDTLEYVFGDYAHRASMMVFTGDAAKFHVAEMEGRRFIAASETKPNTRLNEHILKDFSGGESVSAERKHGQPFTFKPVGKIWMGVNHEPKVTDDSYGFWRRVRLIPFTQTFKGDTDDRNLKDKLRAEAPGILRWCVEGCLDWQEFGLPTPPIVMSATDKYQQQENPLAEFFAEKCKIDPDETSSTSALIAAYTTWCDDQGIRAYDRIPRRAFLAQLEKQFTIVNMLGINRVKGITLATHQLF